MKSNSKWVALSLTAFVMPGAGHFFLKKKLRGALFMVSALLVMTGGLFRYLSVLFAVANTHPISMPPHFAPFKLMAEAWKMDHLILGGFLIALLLVWILAIVDILTLVKKEDLL